ncbi:MAG TPA: heme-copper oxidase subunit III, partial [Chloroflexota bacterium]|nr:heme-copper oxidase subunit III [Chloroflexota bacterium]
TAATRGRRDTQPERWRRRSTLLSCGIPSCCRFLATDSMLFVNLIVTYFTLRFRSPAWPPDGTPKPELLMAGIATILLRASSGPVQGADYSMAKGHVGRAKLGLAAGFILGSTFLALQVVGALQWTFTLGSSAYSSVFIILTSFHAAHVLTGLIMLALALLLVWMGYYREGHRVGLQNTVLFWHFIDIIWVFVFATLHLSPYGPLH